MTALVRPLSTIEASMAYLHARLNGTSQVVTLLTVRGFIDRHAIGRACARMFDRYEILRLRIVETEDRMVFCRGAILPALPPAIDRPLDRSALDALLELELNAILDPEVALWRVRLVNDPSRQLAHIVFTRHHAISDGHTTLRLLSDLLGSLHPAAADPGVVPTEALTGGADELPYAIVAGDKAGDGPAMPLDSLTMPHGRRVPLDARTTGVASRTLTVEQATRLARRAMAEGTSSHAWLSAALIDAVGAVSGRAALNVFTAVSLRQLVAAPARANDLGCFITVAGTSIVRKPSLPDLARDYAGQLRRFRTSFTPIARPHRDIARTTDDLAGAERFRGIAITNLGTIDAIQKLGVGEIVAYRSVANRSGGLFAVSLHITAVSGKVLLSITYPIPLITTQFVDSIFDAMLGNLEDLQ